MPNPNINAAGNRELRSKQTHTPERSKQTPTPELTTMIMELSDQIKELAEDKKAMNEKLDLIVSRNDEVLKVLDQNAEKIESLQTDNKRLRKEVEVLNEKLMSLDQYSRKDILILTGLSYEEEESNEELTREVTTILNAITGNKLNLNARDFIAVHRNGRSYKNDRPPTVTIKFIRFTDKDCVLSKLSMSNCKKLYPHIRMHHGLCPGFVSIRNELSDVNNVKFAKYAGANRFFTVCVSDPHGGEDKFYNRIQNVAHLIKELEK